MKKITLFLLFCISSFLFATSSEDEILGLWITEKGKSGNQLIVEIYKSNDNKFNGRIKDMTIPKYEDGKFIGKEKMDLNNKNEALKNRKLKGIDFVYSFKYNPKKNKYEHGKIYNPENGKEYYSYMKLNKNKTLTVKGSIDKAGFLGKKQIWSKYKK